ncbi:SSI family serine proteinase inhibitor [Spongiactinospora sp. TRM90649]|uniref:SSI family serine proteinase inhibitor n=1 Tax=Spongiactinospora sp. TRM90649 TaxID=3031114 RepID=UPI0023F845C8|nr:SSI family serine proteinase inhibitor [Spongiactinospora sp. TRM90649]MDF5753875.1 SSI family serine proteinase inhibitor [Spongiactinospora sp. TRM90649]
MLSSPRPRVRGVVTTAAAALATASLAAAIPAKTKAPRSMLGITRYDFVGETARHWSLFCDPDGGTHPDARRACDDLRAVGGDLGVLRAGYRTVRCIGGLTPVRIEIQGSWEGRLVGFSASYPNANCAPDTPRPHTTVVPG